MCINLVFAPLRVILSVRDSCIDWKDGVEPESDPAIKGKKDPETGFPISVPRKCVAPSATQVQRKVMSTRTKERKKLTSI